MRRARQRRATRLIALVLVVAFPLTALGREGTLALVNLSSERGHQVVERANVALGTLVGGWARQPSIAGFLAGRPNPGALPVGDVGKDLTMLVERLRARQASSGEIAALGRLLGVDYLVLLRVSATGYAARLFSVQRASYAPGAPLEVKGSDVDLLRGYLHDQTRPPAKSKRSWRSRWWIWGIVAAVAGVTIGLAVSQKDDSKGDLRIGISR